MISWLSENFDPLKSTSHIENSVLELDSTLTALWGSEPLEEEKSASRQSDSKVRLAFSLTEYCPYAKCCLIELCASWEFYFVVTLLRYGEGEIDIKAASFRQT